MPQRLLARKSLESMQTDAAQQGLRRSLGALNLVLLGIGCILGAGIYVMPGNAAALLPLSLLGDLVSIGIGLAFMVVSLSVMWLRMTQPGLPRPFRVPFGGFHVGKAWIGYVPVGAILLCMTMIVPVIVDLVRQAMLGHPAPVLFLAGYALTGVVMYFGYALPRSKLAAEAA